MTILLFFLFFRKINFFLGFTGLVGMSSVIRNHMGAFVVAKVECTRGPLDDFQWRPSAAE